MEKIEEYSKGALSIVAGDIIDGIINTENVSTALVGTDLLSNPISDCVKDLNCVNEYFNSDFGSKSDTDMKKIIASAAVLAKHTGVLPLPKETMPPVAIAAVVDEGLNQIKVAHKVATGVIDADEAVDKLVDLAVARVATAIDNAVPKIKALADQAVEKYTPKVINAVCSAVEQMFPEAAPVTTVVRTCTPYITQATKTIVRKGIDIVASASKKALASVATKAKSFGRRVKAFLFG